MSNGNNIRLVSYKPEAFAGINSAESKSMVIVFPTDNKITVFKGDQGLAKTSNLMCLQALFGGDVVTNALNKMDSERRAELTLHDDEKNIDIVVRLTKTSLTVTKVEPNTSGKAVKSTVNSPKQFLTDLIGNVSAHPMSLKDMKGPEQIKWIRSIAKPSEEALKLEKEIRDNRQKAYEERTEVNRDVTRTKQQLLNHQTYYRWDEENKTFVPNSDLEETYDSLKSQVFNEEEIREKINAANDKAQQYYRAETEISTLTHTIAYAERNVADLHKKIQELRNQVEDEEHNVQTLKDRKEKGEQWIKENESCKTELQEANNIAAKQAEVQQTIRDIEQVKNTVTAFSEYQDKSNSLTSKIDEYDVLHKEAIKAQTPNIPGLEIYIAGMDPQKEEGLYFNGHSMQELSESEIWDLDLQISEASGVKVKLIENISSLGSEAAKRIDWFVENGGIVFCTEMDRSQKELKVEFVDKLNENPEENV